MGIVSLPESSDHYLHAGHLGEIVFESFSLSLAVSLITRHAPRILSMEP